MGAAAMKTRRIRLGTGVLIPSNRIAAVTDPTLSADLKALLAARQAGRATRYRHPGLALPAD